MGVFAEAFGYTPGQFRALTLPDYARLAKYLVERASSRAAAADRARTRGR